ncbi:hypothetical protein AGMMS49975_11900 [Clostridia bacterium]|nr:hypothetical protein AGMMS49975_11900 [Clostridia bacterium]
MYDEVVEKFVTMYKNYGGAILPFAEDGWFIAENGMERAIVVSMVVATVISTPVFYVQNFINKSIRQAKNKIGA